MDIYNSKPPKYEYTFKKDDVVTKLKTTIHNHTAEIHNQYENKINELQIKRDIILEDIRISYMDQINSLSRERDELINQYIYQIDKQIEYISVDNSRTNTMSFLLYIQNIFGYNNIL